MGLFEFRKPKWRHKNPAVRLEWINSIDPQEIEVLINLSREDQDREVRWAAINRLTDLAALDQLVDDADSDDLPVIVARKENLLYDHIVNCQDIEECRDNLDQVISTDLLAKLAVNGIEPAVRLAAVNKIEDQFLLAEIVKQNCGKKPAMAAMGKIIDEGLLADLTVSAASKTSRRLAIDKIAEVERQRNQRSDKEVVAQKLHALAIEAVQLQDSIDMDVAALRLIAIKQEWQDLDSDSNHPDRIAFSKTCNDFEDKYDEILKRRKGDQEKAAIYEQLQQGKLDEICSTIERFSCSTDNNAEAVKDQAVNNWATLLNDPNCKIEPSATIIKRFTHVCEVFDTNRKKINIERELVEVIEKKCAETQELILSRDLKKAASRLVETEKSLAPLKFNYFNKTVIEKQVSDISADLNQAVKDVRDQNLSRRQEICTELEELADVEKHNQIERQLQVLQKDWQQLVKLEDDEGERLEQRYQKIVADLTEKLQTLQHEEEWQLWANLSLKEKLTERVVDLDQEENLEIIVNVIKESQVEWKTIGPVPHKKSQKLWDKFHNACNRNFERAEPYLEELKTRRIEAMDRRRDICTLAAELAESTDWKKTTLAIKELQEEWKTLLRGSRREEQKLYQQFRKACDRFFERRKENYQRKDKERSLNLTDKEKLCEEAEQLAAGPQLDYSRKFKHLQAEWRKIGPVPREKEDAIWKRFRAACDMYFNWLEAGQQKNLKSKEELCEVVEKLLAESTAEDNQKEIAAKLTELQQQWKEIGPVPREQSEVIWQRFREPCDLFFAARQQQFEKEDEQRGLNQSQKEELLAKAEDLASQSTDKKTALQLQELQKEWFDIGPAPREINKELNDSFKSLCDAFFEDRRQYFTDLKNQQFDNQKKKESLCLLLENILGPSYKSGVKGYEKVLSLAEELKQAMEDNFMLAGRRKEKNGMSDEVKRIEQDWEKIGPVPYKQVKPLTERYKKALNVYYKSQRSQKT